MIYFVKQFLWAGFGVQKKISSFRKRFAGIKIKKRKSELVSWFSYSHPLISFLNRESSGIISIFFRQFLTRKKHSNISVFFISITQLVCILSKQNWFFLDVQQILDAHSCKQIVVCIIAVFVLLLDWPSSMEKKIVDWINYEMFWDQDKLEVIRSGIKYHRPQLEILFKSVKNSKRKKYCEYIKPCLPFNSNERI